MLNELVILLIASSFAVLILISAGLSVYYLLRLVELIFIKVKHLGFKLILVVISAVLIGCQNEIKPKKQIEKTDTIENDYARAYYNTIIKQNENK